VDRRRLPYHLFHAANTLVSVTGLVYGWMRYFVTPADPWAVANHPAQPHVQHLHILGAPLLVMVLGWFWAEHAWRRWAAGSREGLWSGLFAWMAILPMVVSGYLIQVAVGEVWRSIWVGVHLVTSGLWLAAIAVHWLVHRAAARRKAAALS
jgi:hypothetical protein